MQEPTGGTGPFGTRILLPQAPEGKDDPPTNSKIISGHAVIGPHFQRVKEVD